MEECWNDFEESNSVMAATTSAGARVPSKARLPTSRQ